MSDRSDNPDRGQSMHDVARAGGLSHPQGSARDRGLTIPKAGGLEAATRREPGSGGLSTRGRGRQDAGFTLLEVLAALAILGLTCSSVLVVIDRCVSSASDLSLRREAFELARENLENILVLDAVAESVDYGTSEKFPDVSWQSVVESFPEPVTGQMWVRAVCSAQYTDSKGENQKVELVHWLTQLTDQQTGQLVDQQELEKLTLEQALRTEEEAAGYAKVDAETIRQWVQNGLVKTADGLFLKCNLDVFIKAKGNPTPEQVEQQVKSVQELALQLRNQQSESEQTGPTGLSNRELEKLTPDQVTDLVKGRRQ